MNEANLVKKAQAGDFEAFNELIEAHQNRLYSLAKRMTNNEQDAQDILQETLLKAVDKIDQFRSESSFGTWLYSIALNAGRAFIGKEKRADLKPLEEMLPAAGHDHKDSKSALYEWRDPHTVMENKQLKKFIDDAIDELRSEYSIPFILRYLEDMSIKEISKIMNISVAAVKSRVLRARLFLREKLEAKLRITENV